MDWEWANFILISFLLLDHQSAEEVTILDTSKVDGNLGWLTEPENGWELGQEMFNGTPSHMFRDCMLDSAIGEEHWLRSSWIHPGDARRIFVELDFTVRDCGSLGRRAGAPCRETFELFYLETPGDRGLRFVPARFAKMGTLAAEQSFTEGDMREGRPRLNRQLRSFVPSRPGGGFYLALRNAGACVALVRLRLSYRRCPPARRGLAAFPGTLSPAGSLPREVPGSCAAGSRPLPRPPLLHCGPQGDWLLGLGGCACLEGRQEEAGVCQACPVGFYKISLGNSPCLQCPHHSNTQTEGSTSCACDQNFYRASGDSLDQPCTNPPSAPRNISAQLLGSKVTLSWLPPLDSGGRADLSYSVSCEGCSWDGESCHPCVGQLSVQPGWQGIVDRRVNVDGLRAFWNYTFTVTALNAVSAQAGEEERRRGTALPLRVYTSEGAGAPPPVTGVTLVHQEKNSISVAWQPAEPRGRGIMGYEVMYQQQGRDQIYTVKRFTDNKVTLTELEPGTTYLLRVRAQSSHGAGSYSAVYQFQTLSEESQAPHTIVVSCTVGFLFLLVLVTALICIKRRSRERKARDDSFHSSSDREKVPLQTYQDLADYEDLGADFLNFTNEIESSHIVTESLIGEGEFGEVFRGTLQIPGKVTHAVAIKKLKSSHSETQWWNFLREATIMGQFNDPNIVHLYGVITKKRPMILVTEFMENGALDTFLQDNSGNLSVPQLVGMLWGISSGMKYLSDRSYVHRDLAARNILVDSELECKVSDFGLSRLLQDNPEGIYETRGGKIPVRWTAPEAIASRTFSSASDVWSFGILIWEVLTFGQKPYGERSNQEVLRALEDGYRLPPPRNCPVSLSNLMQACWNYDKTERPTFGEILTQLQAMQNNPSSLEQTTDFNTRETLRLPSSSGSEGIPYRSVAEWLEALRMKRYIENFAREGLDTMESVLELSADDLRAMGIALPGHQKRILCSIQGFKE